MTDRAAFEQHFQLCSRQALQHKDGSYRDSSVQDKWMGWQAAQIAGPTEAQITALLHSLDSLARSFDREYALPVEWDKEVSKMHALVRLALSMEPGASAP